MTSQLHLCKALINSARFAPSTLTAPFDIADEALRMGVEWYGLMKAISLVKNLRGLDAPKYVLSHRSWHRIIQTKLKADSQCRKEAYRLCRSHPDNGLISKDGDRYTILIQPTR
jgi:hypothetical protein